MSCSILELFEKKFQDRQIQMEVFGIQNFWGKCLLNFNRFRDTLNAYTMCKVLGLCPLIDHDISELALNFLQILDFHPQKFLKELCPR